MDRAVVHYAHSIIGRFPFLDGVAVFLASYLPYLFIIVFGVVLFVPSAFMDRLPLLAKKQRLQFILMTLLAVIIAWGIILPAIRYGYGRSRPFAEFGWTPLVAHEANASFPSGHATLMFTLAASMWQLKKKWGYWFFACAALTGMARVYSLVHYPTDIIFGAVLGIVAVFFVSRIVQK
jgi:undecaprenyl-diphosphatase